MISQREPLERKVRNGFTVTNEYRAEGESNEDVRNTTRPVSPRRLWASESGVWAVVISQSADAPDH